MNPRVMHLYIFYISIYIAPLQGNYSEALPAQARPNRRVLRSLQKELERSRGRERSSEGRSFQTEGPTIEKALFCLWQCEHAWHQKVPLGGRAERSATRAGRSQVEELQK